MRNFSLGYRSKVIFIIMGSVIVFASLLYSNYIKEQLAIKEMNETNLWAQAYNMKVLDRYYNYEESQIIINILNNIPAVPTIMTDEYLNVIESVLIDEKVLHDPVKLRRKLEEMSNSGQSPIKIRDPDGTISYVFYGNSTLLQTILYFSYIQLIVIAIFIVFAFITFRTSKHDEQNRVWIGLAKETAHQLGTPTSSLLGWIEYLKTQPIDQSAVEEMGKDVSRLIKVADRFSKIGSTTQLVPRNICEVVASTINYFQSRIPKNVSLEFDPKSTVPLQGMINDALFEWVIENLLKNALDALQGKGTITVNIEARDKWIDVDVKDTGKGMPRNSFKRIFEPGFTTKTRGWGLGLSLSKRIIEEYHHGKIFVKESEIDKGTTIRAMIKRL